MLFDDGMLHSLMGFENLALENTGGLDDPESECARGVKIRMRLPVVCFYWIVRDSRGFSIVVVEQATESLLPD